ncbi:hypothetical protein HG263_16040 [Pseudoalteromonas sp. JBTF-M23]|uniref:Lipoprotein n=1 Tax=Pseudoalteromonas caenipelagi TaxID=2726988 RepID=A0A849VHU6_9GAMM|nr:hypothetical protein [Pseudoalteromonas caenipelagi]NOU52043.1 hypothetical protein [Pseudoalteromonas caenipelagi]
MFKKKISLSLLGACFVLLMGCSSASKTPVLEIEKQVLHTKVSDSGQQLFVYIVTVEPTPVMVLDTSRPLSRSDLKAYAKHQRVEDSPELKLLLEERAVELLKTALADENYCSAGHKINQVYWRQRSVQLRGACE